MGRDLRVMNKAVTRKTRAERSLSQREWALGPRYMPKWDSSVGAVRATSSRGTKWWPQLDAEPV